MDTSFYNNIILQTNILNGYGISDHWIGYSERKNKFYKHILIEGVNFFLNFFKNDINDFVVAVSYYIDLNKLNSKYPCRILKIVLNAEKELINENYIHILDFDKYFDCRDDEFDNKNNSLNNTFRFFSSDRDHLKNLSFVGMDNSHLGLEDGHCFFISLKNNIIIYPHSDNTGYGCFAIDKEKDFNIGINFLKKFSELDNFDAYLFSRTEGIKVKI